MGVFSVFTEIRVKDGRVNGYVKPLFKDVNVYESKQDKDKPFFKKLYEGIVEGLGDLSHASAVFSRDGRYAFVFGRDGGLSKVDLLTGTLTARCEDTHLTRFRF